MAKIYSCIFLSLILFTYYKEVMPQEDEKSAEPSPIKQQVDTSNRRFLADLRNEKNLSEIEQIHAHINDIILTTNQAREIYLGTLDLYRYRWRGSTVPIDITNQFKPQEKMVVWQTLSIIEQVTCIRFIAKRRTDRNYVVMSKSPWLPIKSHLGMIEGKQIVNVHGANFLTKYTILHLFMHTLGFIHQHQVPNRDDYIEINWDNIAVRHRSEFTKLTKFPNGEIFTDYDLGSIMHFDSYAGTKNGSPTVLDKNGGLLNPNVTLSEMDVAKLKRFYGCK